MATDLRFLPKIPDGLSILAGDEEVAGIQHRLDNARSFASGRSQGLAFEPEPGNPHDPNAIKVMGIFKGWFLTHRVHLGYVSADTAKFLAEKRSVQQVTPRLRNIWWGGQVRDYIVVRFDILHPKPASAKKEAKAKTNRVKEA